MVVGVVVVVGATVVVVVLVGVVADDELVVDRVVVVVVGARVVLVVLDVVVDVDVEVVVDVDAPDARGLADAAKNPTMATDDRPDATKTLPVTLRTRARRRSRSWRVRGRAFMLLSLIGEP